MNTLVALPIALPLLAAALSIGVGRWRQAQRIIGTVTLTAVAVVSVVLLVRVDADGIVAVQAGGWVAPVGISLVVDRLAGIMLVVASLMLLAVLVYAIGQEGAERTHVGFHPVYLIMAAGLNASFITGDLFNLFVAFEVMLTASFVLLTLGGRADQVRSGMTYVVVSLLASTMFLVTLALVYAATGTVNMADLAGEIAALPAGLRGSLAVLMIIVFGVKAAVFPLYFWLPDSYPTAPGPVTAVFAGLLTKVGVYAIIRSQTLFFPEDSRPGTLLLVVAALTMVVGVFGAIAQDDIKRILSFHIVSQVGYLIMGLGLFTIAGVAGAVFSVMHHIVVQTTLFLTEGLVEERAGSGRLARIGGLVHIAPLLAVLFAVAALGLAGFPPFSGFVAKLALVEAGLDAGEYVVVGVSLAVSLLTIYSMAKIWTNAFWGEPETVRALSAAANDGPAGSGVDPHGPAGHPRLMVASTVALATISVGVAIFAGPLYRLAERVAVDLLDPSGYIEAVLG